MAVVEIHTGIITSPKHAPLSADAFRLWLHGLCWSKEHLTDGFIPAVTLPLLHARAARYAPELLRPLVPGKGPLWHEVEGGYQIHDYEQWQETKGRVQERRQQWRERQDKRRAKVSELIGVTSNTARDKDEESRVTHANSPSDGSGGGSGRGRTDPSSLRSEAPTARAINGTETQAFVDSWNRLTSPPLPKVRELTDQRRARIKRRLAERPLEQWQAAMQRINNSAFCRGETGRGWRADLDWLIANQTNVVKVLEGRYDGEGGDDLRTDDEDELPPWRPGGDR